MESGTSFTADAMRALLRRRAEAANRSDAAGFVADYSVDCVLVSPLFGTLIGRAAIKDSMQRFFTAFPDMVHEFELPWIFDQQAIQLISTRGTDTGGLFGRTPTGKPFSFLLVSLMTFANGQIVHER